MSPSWKNPHTLVVNFSFHWSGLSDLPNTNAAVTTLKSVFWRAFSCLLLQGHLCSISILRHEHHPGPFNWTLSLLNRHGCLLTSLQTFILVRKAWRMTLYLKEKGLQRAGWFSGLVDERSLFCGVECQWWVALRAVLQLHHVFCGEAEAPFHM